MKLNDLYVLIHNILTKNFAISLFNDVFKDLFAAGAIV